MVSLIWFATVQQAGPTWEYGRVSLCPLSHPYIYTQVQQPYCTNPLSEESFPPKERQQLIFVESKLEEVAGLAQGTVITLCSVRNYGEVGWAGFILLEVSLYCTASTWGVEGRDARTGASHSPPAGKSGSVGVWAETGHWVSWSVTEKWDLEIKEQRGLSGMAPLNHTTRSSMYPSHLPSVCSASAS